MTTNKDELTEEQLAVIIAKEIELYGKSSTYEQLMSVDWRWRPVDPYTFLMDDYFMGKYCRGDGGRGKLYDKWVDVLLEVLDPDKDYYELIVTGAIGTGKSTMAALAIAYKLYRLSCLKNPARFYGLMEDSAIIFGTYNVFKYKADDNYQNLNVFIENCQYFKDHFPTAKMQNKHASGGLRFGSRIKVIAGSTELHALGNNLLSLLIDEMNFMKGDSKTQKERDENRSQAHKLYDASRRRITSRFMYKGQVPGLMILISSRNTDSSWLENHLSDVSGRKGVYVADFPLWEVKREVMGYCGLSFKVEVGDQFHGSRILESSDDTPRDGARVIDVPTEHRQEFNDDVEGALRDIAGVASVSHAPLIRHRDHIGACITDVLSHPFTKESFSITDADGIEIKEYFRSRSVVGVQQSIVRPKLNPDSSRHVHIDLGEKHDSAGICMGHVSRVVGINPHVTIDFFLEVRAPRYGSIDFAKIRSFIVYLRDDLGYPIESLTTDSWQSSDTRQIMSKLGFKTSILSIDRTDEPYIVARTMLYEHRISMYRHLKFIEELVNLQHDMVKRKVDHPEGGSKDIADAFAGVCMTLSTKLGTDKALKRTGEHHLMPQRSTDTLEAPKTMLDSKRLLSEVLANGR
jgi:hypothetical protein